MPTPTAPTAVTYLRVSTTEQARRGGRDEGYSLPDQRRAVERKAQSMGAVVVEEFVEPGESGKSLSRRKALLSLLAYVKEHDVDYCIIPKVDRLARNRLDDALIQSELTSAGVALVSAAENIDATPAGQLQHGIMASISEWYSANLAQEVMKGLRTKAMSGGTTGKAPIGYRNVRTRTADGYELRTVETDPDRAPLITWAFTAYATGDWTLNTLLDELTIRGLVTAPTPRRPAKPIHVSTLHRTLQNPYYKGTIVFEDVEYEGQHEPLIDPGTWEQVQTVLKANNLAGDKTQTHDHYLKGSLYCGDCESRLLITHAKNKKGIIYPYFICSGRHRKATDCTRKAMHVDIVEQLIINHYARIQPSPASVEELRASITEEFSILTAQARFEREDLIKQRGELLTQREKLLQAHYAGAIPLDLLKEEQDRIGPALIRLNSRLEAAESDHAEAEAELHQALDLASDCHSVYEKATDSIRRLFNQAFFEKIYITSTDQVVTEPTVTFKSLLAADAHHFAAGADHARAKLSRNTNTGPHASGPVFEHVAFGGSEGTRTPDPLHAMQVRYQLRHRP